MFQIEIYVYLCGGKLLDLRPYLFISENKLLSSKHWIREWVSHRPGLDAAKKRIFPRGQLTNKTTENVSTQT